MKRLPVEKYTSKPRFWNKKSMATILIWLVGRQYALESQSWICWGNDIFIDNRVRTLESRPSRILIWHIFKICSGALQNSVNLLINSLQISLIVNSIPASYHIGSVWMCLSAQSEIWIEINSLYLCVIENYLLFID